jgi:hypothetical protein
MTEATYKSGIRSLLDGSREAIEAAIRDAVSDLVDALTDELPGNERLCVACDYAWHADQPATDRVHGDLCVADGAMRGAEAIVDQIRQLITAERLLCDGDYRTPQIPDDDFAVLVAKHRARLGR